MRLLGSLPTEGDRRDQAQAMAEFPQMDQLLHRFGQRFFTGQLNESQVADSGGGFIPVFKHYDEAIDILDSGEIRFQVQPFTLSNRFLSIPPHSKVEIEVEVEGEPYLFSSRAAEAPLWLEGLAQELSTPCDAGAIYELLVTSTSPSGEPLSVTLSVQVVDQAERRHCNCTVVELDSCLIGSWQSTVESLAGTMGGKPDDIRFGSLRLTVGANGRMRQSLRWHSYDQGKERRTANLVGDWSR